MRRFLWCWSLIALSLVLADAARAATVEDAIAAYKRKDYASALSLFRSLAEAGDPRAQNDLGAMYSKGDGVPQDYAEAVKWHRRAAEQGYPQAQTNLGPLRTRRRRRPGLCRGTQMVSSRGGQG
jgi:TPR repeat protein